jgi:hypothetical protein
MGAVAPDPLPAGEVWLDVGNRTGPRVLDQHGGHGGAVSSTRLALERHDELVGTQVEGRGEVTLVLHAAPDLDAIGAAWLVARRLELGRLPGPAPAVEAIVGAIDESDLGFDAAEDVRRSWPVVMKLRLEIEAAAGDDTARARAGFAALDASLASLARGHDLEAVALDLTTPALRAALDGAAQDYTTDFEQGHVFEARLPVLGPEGGPRLGPTTGPKGTTGEWKRTDGLQLLNPRCRLFKELARHDRAGSPAGQGFALLAVSWLVDAEAQPPHWRHIVSTEPRSGLGLHGLGQRLEALEQQRENATGRPLLAGRERVGEGRGRHGSNVASPWYDGRGHDYTIVDSPSVLLGGRPTCASCLQPPEVLEAIRRLAPDPGTAPAP